MVNRSGFVKVVTFCLSNSGVRPLRSKLCLLVF